MKKKLCQHKNILRFRTYEKGDFYYYHKKCTDCKKEVGAWTAKEAEEKNLEDSKKVFGDIKTTLGK